MTTIWEIQSDDQILAITPSSEKEGAGSFAIMGEVIPQWVKLELKEVVGFRTYKRDQG